MYHERYNVGPFQRSKETYGSMPIQEFMQIRDTELAKHEIEKIYKLRLLSNPSTNTLLPTEINKRIDYLSNALKYAEFKHSGKFRLTKEPYIFHPLAVTYMVLQDTHIPAERLHVVGASSANHDVLEDTDTPPSELRSQLGPEATRNIILLSKKIKHFENNPEGIQIELSKIGIAPSLDQKELINWVEKRQKKGSLKTKIFLNEIINGPRDVRRIKLKDREHNLMTIPPKIPPPGVDRSPDEQIKVDKIWKNIANETRKYYIRMAVSLGISGIATAISLRKAYRDSLSRQE